MAEPHLELPQGTLELLILRTLALSPQHGWAISERVQQLSSEALRIQQGSLYPALHRLERRGLIKADWGTTENNRRAKYYELSKKGRAQLEVEKEAWASLLPQWPRCLEPCRRLIMLNGLFSDLSIRLRALFRPKAVEGELDDELHFHFDQQVEKHMRAGLTR